MPEGKPLPKPVPKKKSPVNKPGPGRPGTTPAGPATDKPGGKK